MELLIFTRNDCPNCDHIKKLLHEEEIDFIEVDLDSIDPILEFDLLLNQICIMSAPSIILKEGNHYTMVKDIKELKEK